MFKKTTAFTIAASLVLAMLLLSLNAPTTQAAWSSNPRRAVVLECFYSIRPPHDGGCDKTINGKCVSSWNYLANDWYAYNQIKAWYRCDSSVWTQYMDGSNCPNRNYPVSYFADPWAYGYGNFGGTNNPIGRGGQCKPFANLILYRSGAHTTRIPTYYSSNWPYTEDMWHNSETDLTKAKEGDVIFRYDSQTHVAIVVEIKRDYYGRVTGLDAVDSNFVSDTGYGDREVIARHLFQLSAINGVYRIWKGASYYGTNYDPNA